MGEKEDEAHDEDKKTCCRDFEMSCEAERDHSDTKQRCQSPRRRRLFGIETRGGAEAERAD